MYRPKVYTASKIAHGPHWRLLRVAYPDIEFTARWHDIDGPDHTSTFWSEEEKERHWIQDIQDVQRSDYVLAYCGDGDSDKLKGTLVEVGAAIGLGKIVLAVGLFDPAHSWQSHPCVRMFDNEHRALNYVLGRKPSDDLPTA